MLMFNSLPICGNNLFQSIFAINLLGNIIAAIKIFRKFYHQGNSIAARNFDRLWNCKASSMICHFQIVPPCCSRATFQHINLEINCYRSHRFFFESFCFCGYVFIPQLFPIWYPSIEIVILPSNVQCEQKLDILVVYQFFASTCIKAQERVAWVRSCNSNRSP